MSDTLTATNDSVNSESLVYLSFIVASIGSISETLEPLSPKMEDKPKLFTLAPLAAADLFDIRHMGVAGALFWLLTGSRPPCRSRLRVAADYGVQAHCNTEANK